MRLHISICVPGMEFDGDTLKNKSLGGSETAALCMARELAKLGNNVTVFSNGQPGVYEGVTYMPLASFDTYKRTTPHDVCIVQRYPEMFQSQTEAKLNILWQHDLARARFANQFKGILWNVDRVAVLSDYMQKQYTEAYSIEKDTAEQIFWKTRNGIDLNLFPKIAVPRNRKKIFYSARPERGLDVLLDEIMPILIKAEPDIQLCVARYDHVTEQMKPFYKHLDAKIAALGKNARYMGNLTKKELYQEYSEGGVYVYPTPSKLMPDFAEVSCISMMECMAAGLPVVTSDMGALPETLHSHAGVCVPSGSHAQEFAAAVLRYVRDDSAWLRASQTGQAAAQALDWADVAKEWQDYFYSEIKEKGKNATRKANHFYRHSNIMAIKQMERKPEQVSKAARFFYPMADSREGLEDHYKKVDNSLTAKAVESIAESPRYRIIEQIIESQGKSVNKILDFACNNGAITANLANRFPDKLFFGKDLSPPNNGKDFINNNNCEFIEGDEMGGLGLDIDMVIAGEVLEHSPEPWGLIDSIESNIKPNGLVLITVPYGPWEWGSKDHEHLWEFDVHDLEDMFADKPGFGMSYLHYSFHEITGEAMGFHILWYRADHARIPSINMERKLAFQAPRETLALNMVVGKGSDETIRWSINSVKDLIDSVVITDTGMSLDTLHWLDRQFENSIVNYKVIRRESPLKTGFDAARNAALANTDYEMDWVLWMDTDERLLEPQNINKYLRANSFNGYSVKQIHFSADANFKPDLPVRLFRNRVGMEFYGCIHEHPEIELNKGPGVITITGDLELAHLGYLRESIRRKRFWRNLPMLQMDMEKYPDRLLQKHFICRDNMIMVGYLMEQSNGQITQQIKELCDHTIELYEQFFSKGTNFANIDTRQYYSQALKLLNKGIEAAYKIEFDDGTGRLNGSGVRYASKEDLLEEIDREVQKRTDQLENPWW